VRLLLLFFVPVLLLSCRKEIPLPSAEIHAEPVVLRPGLPDNPREINGYLRVLYQPFTDSTGKVTLDAVFADPGRNLSVIVPIKVSAFQTSWMLAGNVMVGEVSFDGRPLLSECSSVTCRYLEGFMTKARAIRPHWKFEGKQTIPPADFILSRGFPSGKGGTSTDTLHLDKGLPAAYFAGGADSVKLLFSYPSSYFTHAMAAGDTLRLSNWEKAVVDKKITSIQVHAKSYEHFTLNGRVFLAEQYKSWGIQRPISAK
jgi:hypothetical protein